MTMGLSVTFLRDRMSPWINLGGEQLIPTAATFLQESAMAAHSNRESPLLTFFPSFDVKENHAGILMSSSSRSSAYALASILFGIVSNASKSAPDSARTCTLRLWKSFNVSTVTPPP
uniref:Uncharacterized protein n=1 Tax=Opuntia streptacantha TaxID=393608 RepID=A0A7C9CF36_OPUST